MKRVFKSIIAGFLCAAVFSFVPFEANCRELSNEVFRIHILANSDSEEDQNLKLSVRDRIIEYAENLLCDAHSKEAAMEIIRSNLHTFYDVARDEILRNGYDYDVTLSIKNLYFDTRYYGDITMPGGFYDALQIRIGNAAGKNWWCVMYPSLCIFSAAKTDSVEENLTKEEYNIVSSEEGFRLKFKVVELFSGFCNWFRR